MSIVLGPSLTPAETIASTTWNLLKHGSSLDVRLGEETLTDLRLLYLKANEEWYGIRVFQTSKPAEANSGTDLEILVHAGRCSAWKYAIQAKKLHRGKYPHFGKMTSGAPQIDVLEKYAKTKTAIPCYPHYNWIPVEPVRGAWPEQLPSEDRNSKADFIDQYFDTREYRPRRLVLVDPEPYRGSEQERKDG